MQIFIRCSAFFHCLSLIYRDRNHIRKEETEKGQMNIWSVEGERGQISMDIKIKQPDLSKGLHPANKG